MTHSFENLQPRTAATVILIREGRKSPFEVFLMRRHKEQRFMGGAFVFPGGAQDLKDNAPMADHYEENDHLENVLGRLRKSGMSRDKALGLLFTAIRETFEESGVLFGLDRQMTANGYTGPAGFRTALHDGSITLEEVAGKMEMKYTPGSLTPYARWITPEIETRRFDTWFFLARLPEDQNPVHDSVELVESIWLTPEEALQRQKEKGILLMPPTLKILEELSAFTSVDALFSAARHKSLHPILPQAVTSEIRFGIKLPHDPEYTISEYKQPFRPDEPSRIMMIDGMWTTRFFKTEAVQSKEEK